jgi:carboxyl-terminal processing protease
VRFKLFFVFLLFNLGMSRAFASPASDLATQFLGYLENYYVEPEKINLKSIKSGLEISVASLCGDDANCPTSNIHDELSKITKGLPDKTSRFLSPEQAAQKRSETRGDSLNDARFGLGIELRQNMVYRVLENSPADKARVMVGDVIKSISRNNQVWTKKLEFNDNTPVTFALERRSVKFEKSMSPELGWLTNLAFPEASLPKPKIGYVRIPSFRLSGTAVRVHEQIFKLVSGGAGSLILDLRFNTGGLLEEMLLTLSAFHDGAALQLRSRGAAQLYSLKNGGIEAALGNKTSRYALPKPTAFKGNIIILTNSGTASAAELMALILQREQLARFIGEPSYGLCQTALAPLQLLDQSELRLAAVKNLFADGETIPEKLEPDYTMTDDLTALEQGHDLVLETALKWLQPINLSVKSILEQPWFYSGFHIR